MAGNNPPENEDEALTPKAGLTLREVDAHLKWTLVVSALTLIVSMVNVIATWLPKERELSIKEVELALSVLRSPIGDGLDPLRPRAIETVENVWKMQLSPDVRFALMSRGQGGPIGPSVTVQSRTIDKPVDPSLLRPK